jgi:UDP-GlcNAc:undecaprenyl-phosphate GlcNAc-1-phosphate transferase
VELLVAIGALLLVGVVVVLAPRTGRSAREARAADMLAQRRRSRAAHPTARAVRGATREVPAPVPVPAEPARTPRTPGAGQVVR